MRGRFRFIFIIVLMVCCFPLRFNASVKADSQELFLTVVCPSKVYVGETFVCQSEIYNNGSVSHNYTLSMELDDALLFNISENVNASKTVSKLESLSLPAAGDYSLFFVLRQDEIVVHERYFSVSAVERLTVVCPSRVYVGETFVCQSEIYNIDNVSHNYTLSLELDVATIFSASRIVDANETASILAFLTLAASGDHYLFLKLIQDDIIVDQPYFPVYATGIEASVSYTVTPNPVYPNSSFLINLRVTNEGDEPINNTMVTIFVGVEARNKIELVSGMTAQLGLIAPNKGQSNASFTLSVAYDTPPGTYSLRVLVRYMDTRNYSYEKDHYITVGIYSGEISDKFSILEAQVENDLNKMRYDLLVLQQTILLIGAILFVVTMVLAIINYWYAKRLARIRRRALAE